MKKIITILFCFLLTGPNFSAAAVEIATPKDVVMKLLDTIKAIKEESDLKTKEDYKRNEELKNAANSLVNIPWLSEWTLGKHWQERSEKEKKEFEELFGNIFRNVAYPKTGKFFREIEVTFDQEKIIEDKARILTTVIHEKEGEVEIEYKLRSFNGNWLIYDVVMDGVSLGRNLKTKFQKIIMEDSYLELVKRMEKKLSERDVPEDLL